jgi:RNA polymerase sigma-70 factor (ECF subfamily)
MDDRTRAIEDLYRRRYTAFWNVVASVVQSREVGHEVVQEAFATALAKRRQLRDDAALEPWVWRIALRAARARRGDRSLPLDEVSECGLQTPERDLDLDLALRRLPPRRRLVVFLRYFGGLSYAEIAATTGAAEGTVAATLSQAQEQLRRELSAEEAAR